MDTRWCTESPEQVLGSLRGGGPRLRCGRCDLEGEDRGRWPLHWGPPRASRRRAVRGALARHRFEGVTGIGVLIPSELMQSALGAAESAFTHPSTTMSLPSPVVGSSSSVAPHQQSEVLSETCGGGAGSSSSSRVCCELERHRCFLLRACVCRRARARAALRRATTMTACPATAAQVFLQIRALRLRRGGREGCQKRDCQEGPFLTNPVWILLLATPHVAISGVPIHHQSFPFDLEGKRRIGWFRRPPGAHARAAAALRPSEDTVLMYPRGEKEREELKIRRRSIGRSSSGGRFGGPGCGGWLHRAARGAPQRAEGVGGMHTDPVLGSQTAPPGTPFANFCSTSPDRPGGSKILTNPGLGFRDSANMGRSRLSYPGAMQGKPSHPHGVLPG